MILSRSAWLCLRVQTDCKCRQRIAQDLLMQENSNLLYILASVHCQPLMHCADAGRGLFSEVSSYHVGHRSRQAQKPRHGHYTLVYGCLKKTGGQIGSNVSGPSGPSDCPAKPSVETHGTKSNPLGPDMINRRGVGIVSAWMKDDSLVHLINQAPCLFICARMFAPV